MAINCAKLFNRHGTPQSQPMPGSTQVPNSAGGYAWQVDDWTRLDRFLTRTTAACWTWSASTPRSRRSSRTSSVTERTVQERHGGGSNIVGGSASFRPLPF